MCIYDMETYLSTESIQLAHLWIPFGRIRRCCHCRHLKPLRISIASEVSCHRGDLTMHLKLVPRRRGNLLATELCVYVTN